MIPKYLDQRYSSCCVNTLSTMTIWEADTDRVQGLSLTLSTENNSFKTVCVCVYPPQLHAAGLYFLFGSSVTFRGVIQQAVSSRLAPRNTVDYTHTHTHLDGAPTQYKNPHLNGLVRMMYKLRPGRVMFTERQTVTVQYKSLVYTLPAITHFPLTLCHT